MADTRAHRTILELAGRLATRRVALILAGVATAVIGVAAVVRKPVSPGVAPSAQPAYALPGTARRLTVEILAPKTRMRAARVAMRQLRQAGFDVVFVAPADAPLRASRVVARRVDVSEVADIASVLGITSVAAQRDTLRRVDVTVWLGDDFRPRAGLRP